MSHFDQRQNLSRNISTPTLSSGKLPPVHFFPSGSPLHETYNNLLRKATAKSRSSTANGIWDGTDEPIKVARRVYNNKSKTFDRRGLETASSRASSATTDAIENLHFTQQILRRAAQSPEKKSISTPISSQSSRLAGSEARLEVALDYGANVNDLKKNQELVDVLNDVQQVTICFQEIIRHLSYHRVETGRVLWKLQKTYINLFERLVSSMFRSQEKKVSSLKKANSMRDEEMDLLRLKVLDLNKRLEAAERSKQVQQAIIDTDNLRAQSMEAEINDLKAALVSEVKDAEEEALRRAKEEKDIRKQLESDLKQQESKRAALFGQSGTDGLDEEFAKSIGNMNDTINDAEEMVYNQDKLFSDMDSLLMMQKEKMLDDIKNATQSVKEKFIKQMQLNTKGEKQPEMEICTTTTVEVTEHSIALKQDEIKELDRQISLGSEIDSILETQQLESMTDPSKMIEERESRAARYREQRAREEIEQQRASMIKEMNRMKQDIKKKEEAILLEMQNKSVQTPPPSRNGNINSTSENTNFSDDTIQTNTLDEDSTNQINGDAKDAMTQTIVDEECLWDSEESYVVAISGPVLEKIWKERNEAVEKFYGEFVARRKQDPLAGPDEDPAIAKPQTAIQLPKNVTKGSKKKLKRKGEWLITPSIRDFMANIPKTVQAQPIKPLSWLSKTIDLLYQSKLSADYLDLRDGDPLQSLNDFLTEFLLMKYKLRRVAEMHMYEIVMCVKKYFKKNSKVRMFAKFLGCVKDKVTDGEDNEEAQNRPELDIGVLQVFLYVRNRLLTSPDVLKTSVPQTPALNDEALKYDEAHVASTKDCKTFVPLEHAVKEMRRVSNFMARRKLEKFLRTVERAVAIRHPDGKVKPVDGERMQVRFTMRAAMLDNVKSHEEMVKESNNQEDDKGIEDHSQDIQVVADVDVCLEILIEILEIREKQIFNSLIRAFVDGDDNGDGILDIDEFTAIIKILRPGFSARRALRMFKRALEQGEENSSSLERNAFVQTCKEYGLALLVDTRALDLADAKKALGENAQHLGTPNSVGSRKKNGSKNTG